MLSKKHDSYESIRDERRYGPYWYSALWRIIRPILIGLGAVLVVYIASLFGAIVIPAKRFE